MKKIFCLTIALISICMSVLVYAFAEARNIYIGDIINLEINSQKVSEEELRQEFRDFEIIELKKESGGYLLSIRIFESGEHKVIVGDKELVIYVSSTLTDIRRDDIFEAEAKILKHGFYFHWRVLFCVTAGAFIISAGYILKKTIKRKGKIQESPYESFLRRSSELFVGDDNYFVDLTLFFKEFIENIGNCRIIGKTTFEIVNELNTIHIVADVLPDIKKWLTECDVYKFSGMLILNDEKQRHYAQLINIVEQIEKKYVGTNEGAA